MIKKQQGLTLIEMMIAMVIGIIISGAVITIFISNIKIASDNMKMARLNQELRGVMTFISDEIKRAGYSSDAANSAFNDEFNFATGSSCLRYSYDEDGDGIQDADERFGFQLNTDVLRWSNNITTADCSDGTWQDVTDTDIATITAFTITETPVGAGTININHLDVTLTGQVNLTPNNASRTITEIVRVRNEDAS
jgi:prepilin peptidase dependent protein B